MCHNNVTNMTAGELTHVSVTETVVVIAGLDGTTANPSLRSFTLCLLSRDNYSLYEFLLPLLNVL